MENELLEALLNGDTENIAPRSRLETFLLAICEKMSSGGGGIPIITFNQKVNYLSSGDDVAVPEELCETLNAYATQGTPICVNFSCNNFTDSPDTDLESNTYTLLLNLVKFDDVYLYTSNFNSTFITKNYSYRFHLARSTDENWVCYYIPNYEV